MGSPIGGHITLRKIKKTATPDLEPVYDVTFDLRVGGVEETITIPVSALEGHDSETVSIARVKLVHVLAALLAAANEIPGGAKACSPA